MIDKIISFSIRNKLIVGLMVAALIGIGTWSMFTVNQGSLPDITPNQVVVITVSPSLSTQDVEQFITYPVELAMANLPGVKNIRSVSRFGLSSVTVVFEDDMGTYLPRQLVMSKLNQVRKKIPDKFGTPTMGPITTGLGEIYQYTLKVKPGYEKEYTLRELTTMQNWIVKRQMAGVKGIVGVNTFGGKIKQYEVALDPDKLNAMNIAISKVYEALASNNANTGGAYIEKNKMANFIRVKGLMSSLEEIQNTVVKTVNGNPVLIEEIAAKVHIGTQIRYGAATRDGQEVVGGIVMMLKGANSSEVIDRVHTRMTKVEKSLPEGVTIDSFYSRSKLINRTTSTIATNLIEGALIVLFVLVLLLGSIRGGLITASVIPLALLFAFILMRIFGVWANLMSLGAIDFGIIVDGAVIIVEGTIHEIEKYLKKGKSIAKQGLMDEITFDASSTMMNSAFFGQMIILIIFAPILFLQGVAGEMFQPMAYAFGFAVIGAIILCLTYVPAVSALFLKPSTGPKNWFNKLEDKVDHVSDWLMDKIYKVYRPLIQQSLKSRLSKLLVVAASVILLISALFTFNRLGGVFIPQLDEGDLVVQAVLKPGTALSETVDVTEKIENILLNNFPEVKTAVARIGVADIPTDPMPMDIADMFVILQKDKSKWVSADSKDELIKKMREKLSVMPGVNFVFTQPIELRFNELLTGIRQDVAVKIYGEDLDVLARKAQKMAAIIRTVPGAAGVKAEATTGLPQMVVEYNQAKIAQYGLSIEKLNRYINTAFAGGTAGVIYDGVRRFNLVVRLSEENRSSIEDLRNLYIDLPNGEQIPLDAVAEITYKPGPMQISRESTSRYTYVGLNVRGRDVASLVKDIQKKMEAQLELPPGYYIDYGGAFENLQQAKKRLAYAVPVALALIFILLYFALRSIAQALIIYMAVPLAAIGGVFALALRGLPFSISAGVGFIVLFGVAVLNGLVLINRFNELKHKEDIMDLKKRIFMGCKDRLRPVLLTATAAICGFLPMAISTSAGAAVQRPLATVVIGGLITATLLTLVVVPVLYYFVESRTGKNGGTTRPPAVANSIVLLIVFITGMLFMPTRAEAQQTIIPDSLPTITVQKAIQKAKADYPAVQSARLAVESRQALKKTAWDLGMTEVFTGKEEVGNGAAGLTTVLGIRQAGIDLFSIEPKLDLRNAQVDMARSSLALTLLEMEQAVRKAWADAYIAKRKYMLYQELDSIFSEFKRAARLRYEQEAISNLAFLAAKNQAQKVALQKVQYYKNYKAALTELNSWLVGDTLFAPVMTAPKRLVKPVVNARKALKSHPVLKRARHQVDIADAQYDEATSNFLPTFSIQYGFQEIAGQSGFYSFEVGVSIPLFFLPQQGRSQSAKIQRKIAKRDLQQTQIKLQSHYQSLLQQYQKWLYSWRYYQNEALPLAQKQRQGSLTAYKLGSINYVTFTQNIRSAIEVEINALEALGSYLDAKARLSYFRQFSNQ